MGEIKMPFDEIKKCHARDQDKESQDVVDGEVSGSNRRNKKKKKKKKKKKRKKEGEESYISMKN